MVFLLESELYYFLCNVQNYLTLFAAETSKQNLSAKYGRWPCKVQPLHELVWQEKKEIFTCSTSAVPAKVSHIVIAMILAVHLAEESNVASQLARNLPDTHPRGPPASLATKVARLEKIFRSLETKRASAEQICFFTLSNLRNLNLYSQP